ncbi:hypothetical protein J3Q64DRAFT_1695774 [Phycomyces blakesleeanus]|uniref:Uncharacterized protein n=1 Tax=Phycomyces blakesleeanus TaxID=4837 RepID=A0ABR3B7J8_PHYBL
MTPSSLSPHYAAQSPSGRKPDLVAKEVLEWWQTNGKHPFIQPHISSPSNVGANSPENLPLGDKVQLIRLPVASPSAVKEFSQVSSEEPAHLTTEYDSFKVKQSKPKQSKEARKGSVLIGVAITLKVELVCALVRERKKKLSSFAHTQVDAKGTQHPP